MRRDPDLLRRIMQAVEAQPPGTKLYGSALEVDCNNQKELADHVNQLIDAGLLEGKIHFQYEQAVPPKIVIQRLTNAGHDFLDAMREENIWRKVKEKVMRPAASWTLTIAMEYAKSLIREKLGLSPL
jgi:hypothetical protein